MRLLILIKILTYVILVTMLLTTYNLAYDNGYEHGVVAGFWCLDIPTKVKQIRNKKTQNKVIENICKHRTELENNQK